MDDPTARYGTWKAPTDDGQLLLWPAAGELLRQTRDNATRLRACDAVRVQNVALPDVRRRMRAFLGAPDDAGPLVLAGHQAELHHPGVWVKNVLIHLLAEKLGGQAYHVAVDTDAPKHLSLRWPGGSVPLTDDPHAARDRWSGLVDPPTPSHLEHVGRAFDRAAATWRFRPLVPQFLTSLRRLSLESTHLPAALTNALHELDWNLGLRHHALLASPLWGAEPYLLFAYHVLARAGEFAAQYNAALEDYRRRNRIRTPGRPMPDLPVSADQCEAPFWLDDLAANDRTRGTVARRGDRWALAAPDGDEFAFDPSADGWAAAESFVRWLRGHNLRLSPRALMLTSALRLLAADQFVHGIGGAQYDQVADALMAAHFRIDPPRFSVTTATLYFPDAVGRERVCVPCVLREGHALKHAALGGAKRPFVEAIAAAPRGSAERGALFQAMQDRQRAAWRASSAGAWEQRLRDTVEQEAAERGVFDRELFYAVQPEDRLRSMIDVYRRTVG